MRYHATLAIANAVAVVWPLGALAADSAALKVNNALSAYLASHPISTVSASPASKSTSAASLKADVVAGKFTSKLSTNTRRPCPVSCSDAGADPSEWFAYHSIDRLSLCNNTMLLDFALFNSLEDAKTHINIAACTADLNLISQKVSIPNTTTCRPEAVNQTAITSALQLESSGSSSAAHVPHLVDALEQLQASLALSEPSCKEVIKFAYSGDVAIGLYAGSEVINQGVLSSVLEQLGSKVQREGSVAEDFFVQLCDNRSARYSLGIAINTKADLGSIQLGIQSWRNSSCIASVGKSTAPWTNVTIHVPSLVDHRSPASNSTTHRSSVNSTAESTSNSRIAIAPRATCRAIQSVAGDTCTSLAAECGITAAQFAQYNPTSSTLCSPLAVGVHVCCSAGTLPDYTPQPGSNGVCYTYTVVTGDSCSSLAATYDITAQDIETYNANTWGWNGCSDLLAAYSICLSSGYPPMPASVANAVCGPLVNGTTAPPPGSSLTTLNECPLNACCNIWGQCGTTADFCTPSNSSTGAPGTAAPKQNGCISNCGTDIITSTAPAEQYTIAYFEGFNWQRPCLHMAVNDVDTTAYTHIHLAFATFNSDFSINTSSIADQLPLFKGMLGIKKIISIGGWSFSTDPDTYSFFRNAVSSETNRQTLITNIINFLNDNNLDGVDWDWEYPDEPDIPGIPAGTSDDSIGYFLLLDELQNSMPAGKTVSITAPASFWYLQYFPIQALSLVVDYIVYMTYDLHGQWDYGKEYSDPGCPTGNCLRSHVNVTETLNALSMITKAGVSSNQVAVGVSSYGRSFQMTTAGCWTEECTYTGPLSGALPGPCTDTAGYLADYEIGLISSRDPSAQQLWDENSFSNIVVYNETQWVAYMNESNKASRKEIYQALTFLGTADWAVDLESDTGDDGGSSSSGSGSGSSSGEIIYIDPDIWSSATLQVTASPGATLVWPPVPLHSTTTITFPLLTTTVSYSSVTTITSTFTGGSTSTHISFVYVPFFTVLTIPPVTTTAIPVWEVTIPMTSTGGPIYLTSSVQPNTFIITVTPVINATTSIIGATKTTTITGMPVLDNTNTYYQITQTETLGGKTTIIGGKTLAPTVMTITPNPQPTTVPGTVDPEINSKPVSWKSGGPPFPTGVPGCIGCGIPCVLFCDSGCPFCPPNVLGGRPGGGDDGDDGTSTAAEAIETILFGGQLIADAFPTTLASLSDLSSLYSEALSLWESLVTTATPTTTTESSPTSQTATQTPTPTPSADCIYDYLFTNLSFEILNITGWITDGGESLHRQEDGCGLLTEWTWTNATSTKDAKVWFNLPVTIKSGCVERAIVSAGGPKISCKQVSAGTFNNDAVVIPNNSPYIPMDWFTELN